MKNKNLFQSIKCAFNGMKYCFKNERNFKEYTIIAIIFFILNIIFSSDKIEYIIFFSLTSSVFSAEFINTSIEILTDKTDKSINEKNKLIKDIAAAGVLIMGIAFFTAEGFILIPEFINRCLK